MMEPATVRLVVAGVYALSALALAVALLRQPPAARKYCYPFVAVVAVTAVTVGFRAIGVGTVPIGSGELDAPQALADYLSYPLLFGFTAFLAGASRRYLGVVVVTAVIMRAGYDFAELGEGVLGTAGPLTILGGYVLLVGLYFGPLASAAERRSPKRALFYRKMRNLVLFVFAILIGWAMLQLFGFFDPFTQVVTLEYIDLLLRVGFAAFVVMNARTLLDEGSTAGDPGPLPTAATSTAD